MARIAWKSWRTDPTHETMLHEKNRNAFHALVREIAGLKGPAVKIAQMVAMIPGLLPQPYADALLDLCAHGPGMHWSMVLRRMNQELGFDWRSHFLDFQEKPTFAASIGQVHRACLINGQQVAVKIQYPNMQGAIASDMALINRIFKILHPSGNAVDYVLEAQRMIIWSKIFEQQPHIHIPTPIHTLSRPSVLTMSWVSSPSIQTACSAPEKQRNRLGIDLFLAWYTPFYQAAMIHGDPHIGNIAWDQETGALSLLDFGCVRIFSPHFVQSFCHLYQGLRTNTPELTEQAYAEWGFSPLSKPIVEALNMWARFLLAPFLIDQECTLHQVSSPKEAQTRLEQVYTALRLQGGTKPPGAFLIFDRVAVILGSLLVRLQARANWCALMGSLVDSFSLDQCSIKQKQLLGMGQNNGILSEYTH
jgi:predicted unusual protein kinase regulating ubiquinone biosynthesis (AarF/ABC1/UbiB family)